MSLFCFLTLLFIFSINMPQLLLVSLKAYRISLFSIMLEPKCSRQKLLFFWEIILFVSVSLMNHKGCMWAIRNWVLNWSALGWFFFAFFPPFPSTTCRRWQISNWIYEQALWALLCNDENALPLPLVLKKREWEKGLLNLMHTYVSCPDDWVKRFVMTSAQQLRF